MGREFGSQPEDCRVTTRISDQRVRLPFHNILSAAEQERVIEAILEFDF